MYLGFFVYFDKSVLMCYFKRLIFFGFDFDLVYMIVVFIEIKIKKIFRKL